MQERTKELIEFIETYGEDYLEDGTKKVVVDSLKNGNDRLALEILKSIDKKWIERTKEVHKFYIFTDYLKRDIDGSQIDRPIYRSSYLDSLNPRTINIPTLKRIKSKEYGFYNPDIPIFNSSEKSDYKTNTGWEI